MGALSIHQFTLRTGLENVAPNAFQMVAEKHDPDPKKRRPYGRPYYGRAIGPGHMAGPNGRAIWPGHTAGHNMAGHLAGQMAGHMAGRMDLPNGRPNGRPYGRPHPPTLISLRAI